jgi:two-component system, chemotaxis family, CheB/CheR fusion protein
MGRAPARKPKQPKRAETDQHGLQQASCPIVGIGASAGGLEAFQRFFAAMPAESGLAFVLVPHLDAHHKSAMVELLRAYTRMPVVEIKDHERVEANHVYVIAPNTTLNIVQGELRTITPRSRGLTIDDFFQSLAEDQGENAIGIILAGTGSDGTLGLRAIKEHGGLTFAQALGKPPVDSMPRSAAAAGVVDFILPVTEIPARLVEQAELVTKLRQERTGATFGDQVHANLGRITSLLRSKIGHDFSQYKESTCIRRILRRMQVAQITSVPAYLDLLRKDAREAESLFRELLIGVTQFFRDPGAFNVLAKLVIPKLLEAKTPIDPIRVWVPGCATGEEAYSIAILIREEMLRQELCLKVQIFATDIDDHALEIARAGIYPEIVVRGLSPERLDKFFIKQGATCRIVKQVREMCIFSVHNVVKDAPFSKLDLISCRNLLIYFDLPLQTRVLALFHFALRQGGYLFLGPSETVTSQPKLFAKVDTRARLFKGRSIETERFAAELPLGPESVRPTDTEMAQIQFSAREAIGRRAQRFLEAYAPAAVVIDDQHEIMHFSGRTGRFLQPTPGTASLNLFNIVEASLRPDLRTALNHSIAQNRRVVRENIHLAVDDAVLLIKMAVEPLPAREGEQRLYLVVFQDLGQVRPEAHSDPSSPGHDNEVVQHLEAELIATRERLQTTIEELETSNEEMKSSNEEFQSVNEELQSSNEELETSKEELQSVNEELETVNAELNSKVESLDRVLSDRKNLLESTEIAAIFLDNNLRIKSFTPAVTEIVHLIETDVGRPITDMVTRIAYPDLSRDLARVLRTLSRIEQEVVLSDGSASYIMRILPYRTVENVIDGVVVTFIDITARKRGEDALAELAAIVANSPDAIIALKPNGTISSWNAGALRTYGYTAEEAIGRPLSIIVPPDRPHELEEILNRLRRSTPVSSFESERVAKDGRRIHVSFTSAPIRNSANELVAAALVERDITERKAVEQRQQLLISELNHRVKNALATVIAIALRTRKTTGSIEEFYAALEGRIRTLANTHDVLAKSFWAGADLRQIVLSELGPYHSANDTVVVNGPEVFISSRAAVVFGMVFHELATNAAKYGALAASSGDIEVRWMLDGGQGAEYLSLNWRERGGSLPREAGQNGFGIKFIERSIASELNGTAQIDFRPEGLQVGIKVPFSEVEGDGRGLTQLPSLERN